MNDLVLLPSRANSTAITFASYCPVDALDIGALLWIPEKDVFLLAAPTSRPVLDGRTDVFRIVVTTFNLRLATPRDELLELANHPLRWQRKVNLHADGLSVEVVNDIEKYKLSALIQQVVHEVHQPHLIDALRH